MLARTGFVKDGLELDHSVHGDGARVGGDLPANSRVLRVRKYDPCLCSPSFMPSVLVLLT